MKNLSIHARTQVNTHTLIGFRVWGHGPSGKGAFTSYTLTDDGSNTPPFCFLDEVIEHNKKREKKKRKGGKVAISASTKHETNMRW